MRGWKRSMIGMKWIKPTNEPANIRRKEETIDELDKVFRGEESTMTFVLTTNSYQEPVPHDD